MTKEFDNIQFSPILNYPYERWFREVQYNGKELNEDEKKELLQRVNELIYINLEGLPLLKETLDSIKNLHDEFHNAQRMVNSILQFTIITMIDSLVISKYFILADKDYDKRFMRGKMKIILNEGFKKLYGFKGGKDSKWDELSSILKYFPEEIKKQYQELSSLLEKEAKSSSWWKDERDLETHLDAEKLYISRCEDVVESKVMMESLKLFKTLRAVNFFLKNMHTFLYNLLVDMYLRRELKKE